MKINMQTPRPVHSDFEGNALRLGDEVIVPDLDRHGAAMVRGEVVKLCQKSIKINIKKTHHRTPDHVSEYEIQRASGWIVLVCHNPIREQELLNPTVAV